MSLTAIEVIQQVSHGFKGLLHVVGSKTVLEVFHDDVGDPMYGNIDAAETPMDQPTFYRNYQNRMFEVDGKVDGKKATAPEVVQEMPDDSDVVAWANDEATTDEQLSDYLVDVAGEERRNWKRETMIAKIKKFDTTGSAD